jgi:hypothetical protein
MQMWAGASTIPPPLKDRADLDRSAGMSPAVSVGHNPDLLHHALILMAEDLDGEDLCTRPLIERRARPAEL